MCPIAPALHPFHRWLQDYSAELLSSKISWQHSSALSVLCPHTTPQLCSAGLCHLVWGACLQLNSNKTKEVIVKFSSKQRQLAEAVITTIRGSPWRWWRSTGTWAQFSVAFWGFPSKVVQQQHIKWPPTNKYRVWHQFDEDAARISVEEGKSNRPSYTMIWRAERIHQLQQELRTLARQYKAASEEEKLPLAELQNIIRKKLMTLRRVEWHRRQRRERARKRTAFIADPFGFTKQLLVRSTSAGLPAPRKK